MVHFYNYFINIDDKADIFCLKTNKNTKLLDGPYLYNFKIPFY
jgi:hypothetical protein